MMTINEKSNPIQVVDHREQPGVLALDCAGDQFDEALMLLLRFLDEEEGLGAALEAH